MRISYRLHKRHHSTNLIFFLLLMLGSCSPLGQQSLGTDLLVQDGLEAQLSTTVTDAAETDFIETGTNLTSDPACIAANEITDQPEVTTVTEELTAPEPEQTVLEEVNKLESLGEWEEGKPAAIIEEKQVTYDFPVTINKQVEFYLNYFQNEQRNSFAKWLSRSGRYIPLIREMLQEEGLPEDLVYLPLIESGYSLTAYSRARAVGPWQFIRSTARLYGLKVDNYVDERRDPIKSTKAAIAFLKDLHDQFDSWPLAVAGYNAGAGRIRKAIRSSGSDNFWKMAQGRHLKPETRLYVPKLIAAIIIAKEPEKYGFTDIDYAPPLEFETVKVPRWTSLQAVATACNSEFDEIHDLNRELRRAMTPPEKSHYSIKVPVGKKELVAKNLPRVRATVTTKYDTHVVAKGETIDRICKKYDLNKKTLLKANDLRTAALRPGQRLRIPYKTTSYKLLDESALAANIGPAQASSDNLVLHKIQPGETMWDISRKYNVPMHLIVAWNDIKDARKIRAGQQLALYLHDLDGRTGKSPAAVSADSTETESRIASLELTDHKKISPTVDIAEAKNVTDANFDESPSSRLTYHMVQGGDTLWTISLKYQVTPEKIRRWNGLENDIIHPGKKLLLKIDPDVGV